MLKHKLWLLSFAFPLLALGCTQDVLPTPDAITEDVQQGVQDQIQQEVSKVGDQLVAKINPATQLISYKGQDGKTALELLKASHKVETKEFSGVGEFVNSIDGVTPDKDKFWAFYVNGKSSTVGAGQYQSKSTDVIEWKLEAITSSSN